MKTKEIRDLSVQEIEASIREAQTELFQMVNQKRMNNELAKPHQVPQLRKKIARLKTVLVEKTQA